MFYIKKIGLFEANYAINELNETKNYAFILQGTTIEKGCMCIRYLCYFSSKSINGT